MTLKEELEILRGEPIQVFDGDPMDIPCIETSDTEKLCKHPVVSVHMITYNHELYIRQAIEGVMMQKTNFEFELVIGEDCSQDKTREICFEYQKKHPDKIRVLWWHENVSKLGGNGRRTRAHCRGEFIAFCEGDDYWIDKYKLQKQVDALKQNDAISMCITGGRVLCEESFMHCGFVDDVLEPGINKGSQLFKVYISRYKGFVLTGSVCYRKSIAEKIETLYDIYKWKLVLGDAQLWDGLSKHGDVFYDPAETVVYRSHPNGLTRSKGRFKIDIDAAIIRLYFQKTSCNKNLRLSRDIVPLIEARLRSLESSSLSARFVKAKKIIQTYWRYAWFWHIGSIASIIIYLFGRLPSVTYQLSSLVGVSHRIHRFPHFLYRKIIRRDA